MKVKPKLYLNMSPQTTEEGALAFARNMRIDDDGNLVSDYGYKNISAMSNYNIVGLIVGLDDKVYFFCYDNNMELSFTSPGLISEERLELAMLSVPTCGACLSNMAIAPNGDVVPCQSWLNANSSLGNMLTDPWKRIWNAPLALSTREYAAKLEHKCPLRAEH